MSVSIWQAEKAPSNLVYPNFQQDFLLKTNASHQGLGALLSQEQPDG